MYVFNQLFVGKRKKNRSLSYLGCYLKNQHTRKLTFLLLYLTLMASDENCFRAPHSRSYIRSLNDKEKSIIESQMENWVSLCKLHTEAVPLMTFIGHLVPHLRQAASQSHGHLMDVMCRVFSHHQCCPSDLPQSFMILVGWKNNRDFDTLMCDALSSNRPMRLGFLGRSEVISWVKSQSNDQIYDNFLRHLFLASSATWCDLDEAFTLLLAGAHLLYRPKGWAEQYPKLIQSYPPKLFVDFFRTREAVISAIKCILFFSQSNSCSDYTKEGIDLLRHLLETVTIEERIRIITRFRLLQSQTQFDEIFYLQILSEIVSRVSLSSDPCWLISLHDAFLIARSSYSLSQHFIKCLLSALSQIPSSDNATLTQLSNYHQLFSYIRLCVHDLKLNHQFSNFLCPLMRFPSDSTEALVVVDSFPSLHFCTSFFVNVKYFGFDLEIRPNFGPKSRVNDTAILQFGCRSHTFILDLVVCKKDPELWGALCHFIQNIFLSPQIIKVIPHSLLRAFD
jgi:hypothetical protein